MKVRLKPSLIIAVALAVLSVAWIYSGQMENDPLASVQETTETQNAAADAQMEAPPKELPSVRIKDSSAVPHRAILTYTGRTEVDRRAVLRAETEGRVIEIGAEVSSRLDKGALVVKLAPSDRYAQLNKAEALVRQRTIEYDAARKLAGKGFQTESARSEAEANLSSAKAALEEIRVDLARTTLEAPFDGIIESRTVEVGDYVQRGDEIARIVDFGAFVTILPGKDGLLHISQISNERVEKVTDVLSEGQMVRVKVLDVDQRGRIKLSMKEVADSEQTAAEVEAE